MFQAQRTETLIEREIEATAPKTDDDFFDIKHGTRLFGIFNPAIMTTVNRGNAEIPATHERTEDTFIFDKNLLDKK